MNRLSLRWLLVLSCGVGAAAAADPMRPLTAPGRPTAADAAAGPPAARAEPARPLPRLVAIRQLGDGRRQALFGERWVSAGDTLEHARVLAIEPNQVELQTGKARSTLHLLPALQPASDPAAEAVVIAVGARAVPHSPAGKPKR
jgi:hypothetical protein